MLRFKWGIYGFLSRHCDPFKNNSPSNKQKTYVNIGTTGKTQNTTLSE